MPKMKYLENNNCEGLLVVVLIVGFIIGVVLWIDIMIQQRKARKER